MYLAQEVIPAGPGADFGMSRSMFRELQLIAVRDRARARLVALGPVLAPLRVCRSWAGLRVVLEAAGVALSPLWPGRDPLRLADGWLEVCPSHGPPAGWPASEAPVISP
jgi:hypothetical protein